MAVLHLALLTLPAFTPIVLWRAVLLITTSAHLKKWPQIARRQHLICSSLYPVAVQGIGIRLQTCPKQTQKSPECWMHGTIPRSAMHLLDANIKMIILHKDVHSILSLRNHYSSSNRLEFVFLLIEYLCWRSRIAPRGWHAIKGGKPCLVIHCPDSSLGLVPLLGITTSTLAAFPELTPTPLHPLNDLMFLKYFRDLLCAFKCGSVNGAVTLFRVNSSLPSQPTQTSCLIGQCSLNKLLVSTEQMIVNCLPQIILFLLC